MRCSADAGVNRARSAYGCPVTPWWSSPGGKHDAGGDGPASLTWERNPCFWRRSDRLRWRRVYGIDVKPSLANDAF